MKEIIKKSIIGLILVLALGVAAFSLFNDEPAVVPSATDPVISTAPGANGTPEQTPDSNSANATASDKNNASTDNGNADVQQNTDNNVNNNGVQNSDSNTNNNSGVQTPDSNTSNNNGVQNSNGNTSSNSGVQTPDGNTNSNSGVPQNPTNSQNAPEQTTSSSAPSYQPTQTPSDNGGIQPNTSAPADYPQAQPTNKIDVYQNIFKSGTFLMKINDPELGPVTMAMKGNKMFLEASMEGLTLKMLYDGDTPDPDNPQQGTWYIIIDKIKKYSPISSDLVGDMNVEELTSDIAKGDGTTTYTKSVETLDGVSYECESFTDENGNTTKYYFQGDVLVRSDSVSPSGEVSVTEFQEITSNVDDSYFTIPSDYAKWDISWLMNMMG